MKPLYTTEALATGGGRNGHVDVAESDLAFDLAVPTAMGGTGADARAVELEVVIPELDHDTAQALADAAHLVCPYSNATRGNIPVVVTVTDD